MGQRSRSIPLARCVSRPDPVGIGLAPASRTGVDIRECVEALPQAARTPSQALTGTMRRTDRHSERTGSRFPAVSRSAAVTPRGDRSCRFDETACGTERFLGRDVASRERQRPVSTTTPSAHPAGSSGPDPIRLFGAAWASPSREDAPGDDRCPNHPGAPRSWQSLTHPPDTPRRRETIVCAKGTYLNFQRP